jgi:putative NADH-flavin reductase
MSVELRGRYGSGRVSRMLSTPRLGEETRSVKVLVVGATGGLGRDVVNQSLSRGHQTAALARDPSRATLPQAAQIVKGDVLDRSSVRSAVAGQDAVICALGTPSPRQASTLLARGSENLVDAMTEARVRRLACVTLLGLGSSRANCSLFYREVILRMLAPMVSDKEAQEQAVRGSDLDWVLVRPPRFVAGRPRGAVKVIAEGEPGRLGRVVRADLARFLVDCASEDRYVREALAVGS